MEDESKFVLLVDTFYGKDPIYTQCITLILENMARLPVHMFLHGRGFRPSNLLAPGQSRSVDINLSEEWDGGDVAIYVGNYGLVYRVEYFDITSAPFPVNVTYTISYNERGMFGIEKSWKV